MLCQILKLKRNIVIEPAPRLEGVNSPNFEDKTKVINLKLKNQKLKKRLNKYKKYVKCLKLVNHSLLDRLSKIGDKKR